MLASITPLGERGRGNRWSITAAAHLIGATVAGAALGALLGGLGSLVKAVIGDATFATGGAVVVALALVIGVALDRQIGGLRLPTVERQVNERWLTDYRGWVYGLGFGAQLGVGVVTIVTTSATYVAWLAAFATGSLPFAALLGAIYGGARAAPLYLARSVEDPAALHRFHRRARQLQAPVRTITMGGQLMISALLLLVVVSAT